MYGKVASSNGVITLDATNEYLRIYRNDFSMLLYINGDEDGIFIENSRYAGTPEYFEIKGIGIHKFRVSHTDILYHGEQAPFSFPWFGLY